MRKLWLLLLVLPIVMQAQTPDTTYKVSPDYGSAVSHDTNSIYPHYYIVTRRDSTMGIILQGDSRAGSCANVWCALVPQYVNTSVNYSQSGGTFSSFDDAAREAVRVWNLSHPGDTLSTPVVVPPVDTTPKPPVVGYDTTYTQTSIACPSAAYKTCYNIRQNGVLAGRVYQQNTTRSLRWEAGRGTVAFSPLYSTLKAGARRVIDDWHITYIPPVDSGKKVDTVIVTRVDSFPVYHYDTVTVTKYDTLPGKIDSVFITRTVHDTVTIKCDTVVPVDTVEHLIQNGLSVQDAGVDTVGLHIYDWQSRVGEYSVYLGTRKLGVMSYQDGPPRVWFVYRYTPGAMVMPIDSISYPSMVAAMKALAQPQQAAPASLNIAPELPRAVLQP